MCSGSTRNTYILPSTLIVTCCTCHTHTHTQTRMHACTYNTHTCTHRHTHAHTHTYTRTHNHTHTHTHTHFGMCECCQRLSVYHTDNAGLFVWLWKWIEHCNYNAQIHFLCSCCDVATLKWLTIHNPDVHIRLQCASVGIINTSCSVSQERTRTNA